MPIQKSLNQLLAFSNLDHHAKNKFISFIYSWDTLSFRVLWQDWPDPFLAMSTQKIQSAIIFFEFE